MFSLFRIVLVLESAVWNAQVDRRRSHLFTGTGIDLSGRGILACSCSAVCFGLSWASVALKLLVRLPKELAGTLCVAELGVDNFGVGGELSQTGPRHRAVVYLA